MTLVKRPNLFLAHPDLLHTRRKSLYLSSTTNFKVKKSSLPNGFRTLPDQMLHQIGGIERVCGGFCLQTCEIILKNMLLLEVNSWIKLITLQMLALIGFSYRPGDHSCAYHHHASFFNRQCIRVLCMSISNRYRKSSMKQNQDGLTTLC